MTKVSDSDALPRASRLKTLWPGLVFAIPVAALIIVGYLAIQAVARRGEVVTVTFERAAGAVPGETKVLYQGIEAGHLISISPNKDGRRIDFKLRLLPAAKTGLNTNARFWLIGASSDLADFSALRAVVTGVAIGYAPGVGGTPARNFDGLEKAPVVLPGNRGTRYLLRTRTLGSIREGSVLLYRGQPIGKVTDVNFRGEGDFQLEFFVFQPYDSLIKPGDRFWKASPIRLSFAGGGISANLGLISTVLSGAIDVETAPADAASARSPARSTFILFDSRDAARQGLTGPAVRYDFDFDAAAGDIGEGAEVTLLGFQIGAVESAKLAYAARTGKPYTIVTALLYPRQFDFTTRARRSAADWQSASDAKLRTLLAVGYRARLERMPPLVGALSIALVQVGGAKAAKLVFNGPHPRIPTVPGSSDTSDIASQADQILAKVNRIPIEAIGQNLNAVTRRLRSLTASPKINDSISHLDSTLTELDAMLAQAQPQIGPLLTKLNQAASQISDTAVAARQLLAGDGAAPDASLADTLRQLSDAARSIRTLADYLARHPEALIRGKQSRK